jgi:hypothetical protein
VAPPVLAPPPPVRAVPALRYGRVAAVAVACFVVALGAWEFGWRAYGAVPNVVNSDGLWAIQRRRISAGEGDATVLIGSSRTLSDVQLAVWERLDGRRPIQLALEGTSPMDALEDLAGDRAFTGRLVVGVTPGLFFRGGGLRQAVEYTRRETPSARAGQWLSMRLLEPHLAFDDPYFALFSVLERLPWPQRPGAEFRRLPPKLFVGGDDRNARLWAKVEHDSAYAALVQGIWARGFRPLAGEDPAARRARLARREEQIARAAAAVSTLRSRGVEVIFVRHPSGGPFLAYEHAANPRAETWDVLLARTGARGIHFEDHPELQGFTLPEWSHLAAADADRYTEALYRIIARDGAADAGSATKSGGRTGR